MRHLRSYIAVFVLLLPAAIRLLAAGDVHKEVRRSDEREDLARQMGELEARRREELAVHEADGEARSRRLDELRVTIDKPLLARFDRIGRARDGMAVANVRPDGTCAACNIAVPPQAFIRLQRGETLEICASCQRLLIAFRSVDGSSENA